MSGAVLLQTVQAGIEFGGLRALHGFDLELRQGDLKGLIGPNGAGKTTAFNLLTGVYEPTRGEIRVCGERVNGRKPHEINRLGLARTFQNIRLFRALTALDNVRVACLSDERPIFSRARIDERRRRASGRSPVASAMDTLNTKLRIPRPRCCIFVTNLLIRDRFVTQSENPRSSRNEPHRRHVALAVVV